MTHHESHEHTHDTKHSHSHANSDSSHTGHGHSHGHTHSHSHGHEHGNSGSDMELSEKLQLLFQHWIDHNNSHMNTYLSWAGKAEEGDLGNVAHHLKEAAKASEKITKHLEDALKELE